MKANTPTATLDEQRYSESDTLRMLGLLSRQTLVRYRRAGKIGYYRIGARVYYGERHITEFLAACERQPRVRTIR